MGNPVEHVDELEYYEQDSGENIVYQFVVRPGTMGLLSSGRVRLKGPTTKEMDTHSDWHQAYYVIGGKGKIVVGDESYPAEAGYVARVPAGTNHGVVLAEGEEMEYIYFNAFRNQEVLDKMLRETGL